MAYDYEHFQVRLTLTGWWHRRAPHRGDRTACDLPIVGAYVSRDHVLDEDLCPGCFTPEQRQTGRDTGELMKIERDALVVARAAEQEEEWYGDDDADTDRIDLEPWNDDTPPVIPRTRTKPVP